MMVEQLSSGDRVQIVQRIDRREGDWTAEVIGVVEAVLDAPTGSWYAHGKKDKYWLKRIRLREDNGEMTVISLEEDSRIVLLPNEPDKTNSPGGSDEKTKA